MIKICQESLVSSNRLLHHLPIETNIKEYLYFHLLCFNLLFIPLLIQYLLFFYALTLGFYVSHSKITFYPLMGML